MKQPDWAEHGPSILSAIYAREKINTTGLRAQMIGTMGSASARLHFNEVSDYFSTPIPDPDHIDTDGLDRIIAEGIEHALIVDQYLGPNARTAVDALESSFEAPPGKPASDHPYYRSLHDTFAFASMRSVLAYIDPNTLTQLEEAKNLVKQQRNLAEAFEERIIAWTRKTNGKQR